MNRITEQETVREFLVKACKKVGRDDAAEILEKMKQFRADVSRTKTPAAALFHAFEWIDTPQGYDFWHLVHRDLEKYPKRAPKRKAKRVSIYSYLVFNGGYYHLQRSNGYTVFAFCRDQFEAFTGLTLPAGETLVRITISPVTEEKVKEMTNFKGK